MNIFNCIENLSDLHAFLCANNWVHIDTICKEIMISEATFYRLIRALREKFGAVIECKKYVYRLVKKAEFPERYYE